MDSAFQCRRYKAIAGKLVNNIGKIRILLGSFSHSRSSLVSQQQESLYIYNFEYFCEIEFQRQ